ncbi:hypothetical protein QBC33DRAFT_462078 [Phialemonium atrogriseum]|uniref:HNH nuclease domain-containing protein n=1 Tax=Phialemonium atrogriseum TaxID=1093897 RepID=A0AAJ0BSD0_9PEZI|nr:uncharacterized protein QBC33DRAFT_462078 [Phialemonium atrogriseum]KAK1762142.1 hypothetical protein QBC33DRAFT_462078 [Phialemonium atrogriseum]
MASATSLLRLPVDEPSLASWDASHRYSPATIDFLHPGYPDGDNTLLSLPALDDGGIYYDIALAACGVIADNTWSTGFFVESRPVVAAEDIAAKDRVAPPQIDRVLRRPRYYFCVPGFADHLYPIVPRFSDWRFPHGELPDAWTQIESVAGHPAPDPRFCRLTGHADGVEGAHLVPVSQLEWFNDNRMSRYARVDRFSTAMIDCDGNVIPLRSDIHKVFDERHFCFVPKHHHHTPPAGPAASATSSSLPTTESQQNRPSQPSTSPAPTQALVVHVFNPTTSGQLQVLYHNRAVHGLSTVVEPEFLFARFAWTILSPSVSRHFLPQARSSRLLLLRGSGDAPKSADPDRCYQLYLSMRSRSTSPKKRMLGSGVGGGADAVDWGGGDDDGDDGDGDDPGDDGDVGDLSESNPDRSFSSWADTQSSGPVAEDIIEPPRCSDLYKDRSCFPNSLEALAEQMEPRGRSRKREVDVEEGVGDGGRGIAVAERAVKHRRQE